MKRLLVTLIVVVLLISCTSYAGGWKNCGPSRPPRSPAVSPQSQAQGVGFSQGALSCGIGYARSGGAVVVTQGATQTSGSNTESQCQVLGGKQGQVRCGIVQHATAVFHQRLPVGPSDVSIRVAPNHEEFAEITG